jgi:hypothetical protein
MAIVVVMMIGAVIILAVTVADPDFFMNLYVRFEIEDFSTVTNGQIQAAAVTLFATAAIILAIMHYIDNIFTNIHKNNTPFMGENVRSLKIVAVLVFAAAFVPTIISAVAKYFLEDDPNIIVGSSPFVLLLMAFVIYGLSIVFSYGTALQKESDETL